MKKITAMLVLLAVLFCLSSAALAVNEDVEGELVIYSSAYPEVLDMLDEALKKEFPNLTPGNGGSFFFSPILSLFIVVRFPHIDHSHFFHTSG